MRRKALNVLPRPTVDHVQNGALPATECARQAGGRFSACEASPDFHHLDRRQPAEVGPFTTSRCNRSCSSALCISICGVIDARSQKQVIRPYARRVITAMQYAQVGRNRAIVHFPRQSMGRELARMRTLYREFAVALAAGSVARPDPAGTEKWRVELSWPVFVYPAPEPLNWRSRLTTRSATRRAKPSPSVLVSVTRVERLAAELTDKLTLHRGLPPWCLAPGRCHVAGASASLLYPAGRTMRRQRIAGFVTLTMVFVCATGVVEIARRAFS